MNSPHKPRTVGIEKRTAKDGTVRYDARWYCPDWTYCEAALKAGRKYCRGHKKGTCGFKSRAEALAAGHAAQAAAARSAGQGIAGSIRPNETLNEIADRWFDSGPAGISPRTMRGYRERWRAWNARNESIGLVPVASIDKARIMGWMQELRRHKLSASTMRQDLILLKHILGHATDLGTITANPAAGVVPPASLQGKPAKRARLKPYGVAAVGEHVGGTLGDAIIIGLYTGLRLSELLGLRSRRLDRGRTLVPYYTIDVREQWDEHEKVYRLPKREKTRTVPIHEDLELLIDKHLLQYPASATEYGIMFATSSGTHYSQTNVRKVWKRALSELGLPSVALHSIRATAIDMWIDRGLTFEQVASMVGHKSSEITRQVYYRDLTVLDTAEALLNLPDMPTPIAIVHSDGSATDAGGSPVALGRLSTSSLRLVESTD